MLTTTTATEWLPPLDDVARFGNSAAEAAMIKGCSPAAPLSRLSMAAALLFTALVI